MKHKYKRYAKNYLINKKFQIRFLSRFFIYTFILLSVGTGAQYYISNKSILNELRDINQETIRRQEQIITFLKQNKHATNPAQSKLPPALQALMKQTFASYNQFLKSEIRFINTRIKRNNIILSGNAKNLFSAFWGSMLIAGIALNLLLALIYGILLSHKFAGNHYRLQKFAKQLQDKVYDLPLKVREKDFFQETAVEFDKVRVLIKEDIQKLKTRNDNKSDEILDQYRV